jgi:malonyl CoA-acyl carrier protein transacylase
MSKAFLFPGQGNQKEGMGKDLVGYFTDAVIEVGSLSSGIDVSTSGVEIFVVIGSNDVNVQ